MRKERMFRWEVKVVKRNFAEHFGWSRGEDHEDTMKQGEAGAHFSNNKQLN
jgi:hypothetical protein